MKGSNAVFGKGTTVVNLGLGLVGFGSYALLGGSSGLTRFPLILISGEHGLNADLGPGVLAIGGLIGYRSASYIGSDNFNLLRAEYKWKWSDIYVGARGIYHYQLVPNPKVDTYGGVTLGVRISSFNDNGYFKTRGLGGYKASSSYLSSGLFVGARYYFTDMIAAYGEFGYDLALLKLGVSARF